MFQDDTDKTDSDQSSSIGSDEYTVVDDPNLDKRDRQYAALKEVNERLLALRPEGGMWRLELFEETPTMYLIFTQGPLGSDDRRRVRLTLNALDATDTNDLRTNNALDLTKPVWICVTSAIWDKLGRRTQREKQLGGDRVHMYEQNDAVPLDSTATDFDGILMSLMFARGGDDPRHPTRRFFVNNPDHMRFFYSQMAKLLRLSPSRTSTGMIHSMQMLHARIQKLERK